MKGEPHRHHSYGGMRFFSASFFATVVYFIAIIILSQSFLVCSSHCQYHLTLEYSTWMYHCTNQLAATTMGLLPATFGFACNDKCIKIRFSFHRYEAGGYGNGPSPFFFRPFSILLINNKYFLFFHHSPE